MLFVFINFAMGWCQQGAVFMDSVQQEVIIPWFNSDSIAFRAPNDTIFYLKTATEVDSFSLEEKGTYISTQVPTADGMARKFLFRISDGQEYDLFRLEKEQYFITKGEKAFGLSARPSELQQTMEQLSDSCDHARDWARVVKLKEDQLSFFTTHVADCPNLLFPRSRFGINLGRAYWQMAPLFRNQVPDAEQTLDVRYGVNYAIGFFGEFPIGETRKEQSYANIELIYCRQKFDVSQNTATEGYSASVDFSSLELPVQARRFFTVGKIHPFINVGVNNVLYLSQNTVMGWASNDGSSWNWQYSEEEIFTQVQFGYTFGGGVTIPLTYRRMLYLQGRFAKAYGLSGKRGFSYQHFTINAGINL